MNRDSLRCICFDCDSTLSTIEGIDELAARAGCEAQIAPLTTAAMDGKLAIEDVYAKRLEILKPGRDDLAWLGERYKATVVPGAQSAIDRLRQAGREVFIISGGIRGPVVELAKSLGVGAAQVRAVDVRLDSAGRYAGFDSMSPLTRSNGKAVICAALKDEFGSVALVGDGVTDVAARSAGVYVIGFGGVAKRPAVVEGANRFIDGPSLEAVTDYLLG